jgi:hypothetical protein
MAVVYLSLHKLAARANHRPDSRLLWFFGIVTAPLTLPVRAWSRPEISSNQILTRALLIYAMLWLLTLFLEHLHGTLVP